MQSALLWAMVTLCPIDFYLWFTGHYESALLARLLRFRRIRHVPQVNTNNSFLSCDYVITALLMIIIK